MFINKAKKYLSNKSIYIIIVAFALIIGGLCINMGWFTDDYLQKVWETKSSDADKIMLAEDRQGGIMHAYSLFNGDTDRTLRLIDKGILPWWTSLNIKNSFWRPVSAVFISLDYTFWPSSSQMMHLHTLIWFVLLAIVITMFFRIIIGNNWASGLASLIFIVGGVHPMLVIWLANRYTLITLIFSLLTMIFFIQFLKEKSNYFYIAALCSFLISLLSGESGICVIAYVFSYLLLVDKQQIKQKIKVFIPFIAIIFGWRLIYVLLGYGVKGSSLYHDPLVEPVLFIGQVILRLPEMIGEFLLLPPFDVSLTFSPQSVVTLSVILFIIVSVFLITCFPVYRRNSLAQFFLLSMVLAFIPLCAGHPESRRNSIAIVGGIGFLAMLLYQLKSSDILKQGKKNKACYYFIIVIFIFMHGFIGSMNLISSIFIFPTQKYEFEKIADFGSDISINNKNVIVLGAKQDFLVGWQLPGLFVNNRPVPNKLRILTPDTEPCIIKRIDSNTLRVEAQGGYCKPPGPIDYVKGRDKKQISIDNLYYRMQQAMFQDGYIKEGSTINLSDVTIKVTALTPDDRPYVVDFCFKNDLGNPNNLILSWNSKLKKYEKFTLPDIGKTIFYNYTKN